MASPDENERAVRASLLGSRFADVRWVASTDSTNTDLIAASQDPECGERVLTTDFQAAGKGRRGRTWAVPLQAGLLMSVLVRDVVADDAHRITSSMGLAAIDACRDVAGVEAQLKWPNDLLVGGKKLAGILAEASFADGPLASVVVGMGMNVNWADAMPADLAASAVALDHLAGRTIDRAELLVAVVANLEAWLARPSDDVRTAHRERSATIGQTVRVEQVAGSIIGEAVDIADDGQLVVQTATGRCQISVGDVVHLRLA